MKTVTEQQIRDFREQQHNFTLTFSDGTILGNNDIVLDSVQITRTLCDSEQLSFGTVYASEFSVQIFNDGRKYDGLTVEVTMTAGTYSANFGTYLVVSNPRSSNLLYRTLTAYDAMAAILSTNYADWHNGLKTSPPATIGAYRNAFFTHIGITQASTVLCNDTTAFTFAETTGALSGATILGEICAINGTFGYLDFDQTFKWVTPYIDASGALYPALTLYPSTTLYPMSVESAIADMGVDTCEIDRGYYDLGGLACEEFVTENISQVYMHMGDVVYASGTVGNRLTFTNTLFTMEPNVAVQAVANVRATVKDFNYTPTSVTMLATPWLELCDVVVAEVSDTEQVYFPVLNFVITGTGAIRQTIEAKGTRINSDEATSTDYKIITASNAADYAADLARQAQQAANTAQEAAETAQESADTAQEAADTAQTTAETAQQTADDAQTAADTAQETADNAQTAADTAQETADTAQETAEEAQQMAEDAAKVATNYLHFSNNKGLIISQTPVTSDAEAEALTASNSRVTTAGFDVYKDGTNRVAHFGESAILGAEDDTQLHLEKRYFAYTSAAGHPIFMVTTQVEDEGKSEKSFSLADGYLNADGTLNESVLAQKISDALAYQWISSGDGDTVVTTDGAALSLEVIGYGVSGSDTTKIMKASTDVDCQFRLDYNVISVQFDRIASSTWANVISDFVSLFPSGTKDYSIHINLVLTYSFSDTAMALGNRPENIHWGARSVTFGVNNAASGTGAFGVGRDLNVQDDYSMVIGENNSDITDSLGNHMPTVFAVATNNTIPFAVLKNGIMIMSSVNSGKASDIQYAANSRTDVRINFKYEYPSPPFIFLTLFENNIPANRVSDYASVQIYLKAVDVNGFTATVVNGGSNAHTFSFNWFAISIM